MSVFDTQSESTRGPALDAAADAVRDGRLIVLPTDTVYGIGADAFSADAVRDLLEAKDRGRDVPPPVLVADPAVLLALAVDVPDYVERLTEEFWPGPLTVILTAQPSLAWDLGETRGTVALRMPDDPTALELLRRTGPLAVSSANRHGRPAALSVMDAATQLGDAVEVYLDGGPARIGTSSTIVDATVEPPEIVRDGALTRDAIIAAVGDIFTATAPEAEPAAEDGTDADPELAAAASTSEGADAGAGTPDASASSIDGAASDPGSREGAEATPTGGILSLPSETESPVATLEPEAPEAPEEAEPGEAGSRDG